MEDSISIQIRSFFADLLDVTASIYVSLGRFEVRKPYRELTANLTKNYAMLIA